MKNHVARIMFCLFIIVTFYHYYIVTLPLEQPVDLRGRSVETTVTGFDITLGKACYHQNTLGQTNGITTCWQGILVNIDLWQLYDADGVGEDGLCLSVFIASSVNLQFGRLGEFAIIVFEEPNE